MIAIDTNVIVRVLVKDDPGQTLQSQRLLEGNNVFIPDTVILESYWILRNRYQLSDAEIRAGIKGLMGIPTVFVQSKDTIALVLDWHERGLEFPDAFHLASSTGATSFATFDQRFANRAVVVSDRIVTLLTS